MVDYLFGAGALAALLTLVTRIEAGPFVLFLIVFAILAVVVLALLAWADNDPDLEADQKTSPLPIGFGRALLEKLPTALILINDKGRITYSNSSAQLLIPRLKQGMHYANLFRAPAFVECLHEVLIDGVGRDASFSLPGQDRVFQAQIAALPPGGDFGEPGQVIVQVEDRTIDVRMEAMRSDFIANASHELRTPLASIIGYIETIQGHARDDPQARERFLGIMSKQADRMNRLIEDLMSLSRIEMNAHVPPEDICDVHSIVLEVAAALQPVAEKADVRIDVRLVPGTKKVTGDYDQLAQVVTNLIDNAVKYGGGKPVKVFEAKPNDKYPRMVGISVEDQGAGISRADLNRLTERFYRTNVAQSRNSGGTGLGLAIVKHIVNRHGGELQIESQEDVGSRFTFWIPEVIEPKVKAQADLTETVNNV